MKSIIYLLLLSVTLGMHFSSADPIDFPIVLNAKNGKHVLWSITVRAQDDKKNRKCLVTGAKGNEAEKDLIALLPNHTFRECDTLYTLGSQILKQNNGSKNSKHLDSTHEPDYEVLIDGKSIGVEFTAPSECTLSFEGEFINCKDNKLTSSQRYLIKLRHLAQLLGWNEVRSAR